MLNLGVFEKILIHVDAVDFRKGRKSLAVFVQANLQEDPFSRTLFVFRNRKRDTVKALYWDLTGFAMWEKELEEQKFPWPKNHCEKCLYVTSTQLEWLLKGVDIQKIKTHRELNYCIVI